MTIYALFSDDLRVMFFNENADIKFDVITLIAITLFTIEIVISTLTVEAYYKSFFMYLDIISTLSLIFDIQFLFANLFSGGGGAESAEKLA